MSAGRQNEEGTGRTSQYALCTLLLSDPVNETCRGRQEVAAPHRRVTGYSSAIWCPLS